jgi:hypothetical protein
LGNLKGRDYLEELGIDGRITLKQIFNKYDVAVFTGFIWLRIWASSGLLLTR